MILLLPLLALGCIPEPGPGDTDTTPNDTDTHDTTPEVEVLVDTDALLPGPDGWGDYVDFHFDFSGEPTWVHITLTSVEATTLNGILQTPTQACALSVPYWTAYMEEHSNQGWVRLEDPGRHTLSVFGEAPGKGAPVHCLVETVPVEDDLPFQDAAMACFLGDDTCTCSEVCGCDEIHSR
ncbi:MAG: hypothetical protein ABIO70_11070 [Pseudomonadota bacterium]